MSTNPAAVKSQLTPPHGRDQICALFGDISRYILPDHSLDPRWESGFLARASLPFAIPLSWDKSRFVAQIKCHKLLADTLAAVFARIHCAGLQQEITSFGGCFCFRPQRTGTKLSTHAWGIAVDLNPETNAQATQGSMNAGVIAIFKDAGFQWGGDWQGRLCDPMHFQFCSGY
ncbi:MAG TPA: M15 family metallopeptidase [Terriglobales bacterium]